MRRTWMSHRPLLAVVIVIVGSLLLHGCGEEFASSNQGNPTGPGSGGGSSGGTTANWPIGPISLELDEETIQIDYDNANGKTSVIVQFIVRDSTGRPAEEGDVVIDLMVDDAPIDEEALLEGTSEKLDSDLLLYLVLDASYSMLLHTPPAFERMKQEAKVLVETGSGIWAGRQGQFLWRVIWFEERLNVSPDVSSSSWVASDILAIPKPISGTATKLYGAVDFAAKQMGFTYSSGIAAGPRDRQVMVVLSDGKDNYSYFNNGGTPTDTTLPNGKPYQNRGYGTVTLNDLLNTVANNSHALVYVLGLGSDVDDNELQAIADAGNGRYFKDDSGSDVTSLFDSVATELTTIQTYGAEMPLQADTYTFTIAVKAKRDSSKTAVQSFQFRAGDNSAGLIN